MLLTAASVALGAAGALVFRSGNVAPGILICGAVLVSVYALWRLVCRLIGLMSSFASALEMGDTSVRICVGEDDARLREMSASANRIIERYRSNCLELETRKLYYDRILNVMTHEMRNAITPVIALSSDMAANPDRYSREEVKDAIEIIKTESEGIKRFLDAYYQLTHLPEPELAPLTAREFIHMVKARMSPELAGRGLSDTVIEYQVAGNLMLNIDSDLMRQAVGNLLRNSLDAVVQSNEPHVSVVVSATEGHPFIRIEDNGTGIADEARPYLFQPFYSTKPCGSGIGLFLSRQIARLHGGELRLVTGAGRGVCAILTLP